MEVLHARASGSVEVWSGLGRGKRRCCSVAAVIMSLPSHRHRHLRVAASGDRNLAPHEECAGCLSKSRSTCRDSHSKESWAGASVPRAEALVLSGPATPDPVRSGVLESYHSTHVSLRAARWLHPASKGHRLSPGASWASNFVHLFETRRYRQPIFRQPHGLISRLSVCHSPEIQ